MLSISFVQPSFCCYTLQENEQTFHSFIQAVTVPPFQDPKLSVPTCTPISQFHAFAMSWFNAGN